MKGALWLTAAAGLVGSAFADGLHHRHEALHHRRGGGGLQPDLEQPPAASPEPSCGCTTRVVTRPGSPVTVQPTEKTTTIHSTSYTTRTVSVYPSEPAVPLPTPIVTVYPTPGTYTVPATTVVVTSETTVCAATSTSVEPGTHTYGGVTTVVETATTVTCPVPTVSPIGSTETSVLTTTTYVCPSGGTYTIAPTTSTVDKPTVIVYPTPATYTPGTYEQPEQTVTAIETDFVYVCPAPTAPAPSSSKPAPEPSTPPAYTPPTEPEPTTSETPAPEPSATDKPKTPGGGKRYGITYTPYASDGQCRDASGVQEDIAKIKLGGFEAVRVYAPDCDALENVGSACAAEGIQMIVGVFVKDGVEGAKKQVQQIADWANWGIVDLVVVGNEAIHAGKLDITSLVELITFAKETLSGAGYSGLVTTAEPLDVWQENSEQLCPVCDIAGGQFHPFFNGQITSKGAGEFVAEQISILGDLCGKDVLNLETGWPSEGNPKDQAVPGVTNQAEALLSILQEAGGQSVILSFNDDPWKEPGEFGIEQHWGCITSLLTGALSSLLEAL